MRRLVCLGAALSILGCGGGPRARVVHAVDAGDPEAAVEAYDRLREVDGDDPQLLGRLAALVLVRDARGDDAATRDAALTALGRGGVAATEALETLAEDSRAAVRASALSSLLSLGRESARGYLAALIDDADPEVRALALEAWDPARDQARFLSALAGSEAAPRLSAARLLGRVDAGPEVRLALAEVARVDPEGGIRAAATRALGAYGPAAVPFLRERLSDPFSTVRLAAVGALLSADPEDGAALVESLLATPPSPASIEAARRLAQLPSRGDSDRGAARAYLRAGLHASDTSLRAQAAVALASLGAGLADELRAALAEERDPGVRLGLARALLRSDAEAAAEVLRELLAGEGMAAVQAASMLSARGDARALRRLEAALEDSSGLIRRVALRAIALDAGHPERVRGYLLASDAAVRVAAAGAILAAANR